MGKKAKKLKEKLFAKDYSKITTDEQQRFNDLAVQLMDGTYEDDLSGLLGTERKNDKKEEKQSLIELIEEKGEELQQDLFISDSAGESSLLPGEAQELLEVATGIHSEDENNEDVMTNLRVVSSGDKKIYSAKDIAALTAKQGVTNIRIPSEEDENDSESEEDYTEENYETEDNLEEETLDTAFQLITVDEGTGDIIITDPYKDFKSHTISTFNLVEARTNYESSTVYNGMLKNIPLALAFIAGPIMVVRPGNEMFQNFISTVEGFDRDHLFILNRTEETKDKDGKDVIDFLVYYIDPESVSFIMETIKSFQSEESDYAIDFMYAIFKKAMDRHENPWSVLDWVDNLVEREESQDEDVEYVMDLITEHPATSFNVKLDRMIGDFMKEFTRPIDNYIDPEKGIFTKNCKMLKSLLDERMAPEKDGVLMIPDNFSVSKTPKPYVKPTPPQRTTQTTRLSSTGSDSALVYKSGTMANTPFKDKLKDLQLQQSTKVEEENIEEATEEQIKIDEVKDSSEIKINIQSNGAPTEESGEEENPAVNPAQSVAMEGAAESNSDEMTKKKNMKVFGSKSANSMTVVRYN